MSTQPFRFQPLLNWAEQREEQQMLVLANALHEEQSAVATLDALVRQREGERILAQIKSDAYVVALAIDGKPLSSDELARHVEGLATYGRSHVAFVIGGSLGLAPAVLQRAELKLSFGRMTLPHQLMRLVLVEQVYRAFKIMRGEPYHK